MDGPSIKESFLTAALAVRFADKYYELCSRFPLPRNDDRVVPLESVNMEISRLPVAFTCNKKGRFFRYAESTGDATTTVTIALLGRSLEVIVGIESHGEQWGDSFDGLALKAATDANPNYDPEFKYPRPHFATHGQLASLLPEVWQLYLEFMASLLATAPTVFKSP
jgi:hypothetical protein